MWIGLRIVLGKFDALPVTFHQPRMRSSRVADRIIIVTGAGHGIGRGLARHLARRGASVVIAEWRADRLEEIMAELERGKDGLHLLQVQLPSNA
jgi:NADP-dependent 3-hydroxy acid dehydrogenase YdfG